jgi:hypothetical protein
VQVSALQQELQAAQQAVAEAHEAAQHAEQQAEAQVCLHKNEWNYWNLKHHFGYLYQK